jgi:hypothetical protein
VLTKADLLPPAPTAVTDLIDRHLGMTRHALTSHCPSQTQLAVSSLGGPLADEPAVFTPKPAGLAEPLLWLRRALQAQDEARLARLWETAGGRVDLVERAVACFARRYPDAPAARQSQKRLAVLRRRRTAWRLLAAATAALALFFGVWTYDALGRSQARRFSELNADDPEAVKQQWIGFQFWHPTRNLFNEAARRAEAERLNDLDARIEERRREREARERAQSWKEQLADLRRRAASPDCDAVEVSRAFQQLQADFPEFSVDDLLRDWQAELARRAAAERARRADEAFRALERLEAQADLKDLLARADQFLKDHGDSSYAPVVTERRRSYLRRIDEKDYRVATQYSARYPANYHTRRELFQHYLERHPQGAFARQAEEAVKAIEADWDRHDFRAVRDQFQERPADLKQLDALCLTYLAAHPQGGYRSDARKVLKWSERTAGEREYQVTLKSGRFDPGSAGWFSSGLHLSVELEVDGVVYGPSTIVRKTAYPEWNYQFPSRVRWKMGDAVKIKVTDHYYWKRTIVEIKSDPGDPLAMRLLSGEARSGKHTLTFESDFELPVLPRIE